jgi:hypothetical protein
MGITVPDHAAQREALDTMRPKHLQPELQLTLEVPAPVLAPEPTHPTECDPSVAMYINDDLNTMAIL